MDKMNRIEKLSKQLENACIKENITLALLVGSREEDFLHIAIIGRGTELSSDDNESIDLVAEGITKSPEFANLIAKASEVVIQNEIHRKTMQN